MKTKTNEKQLETKTLNKKTNVYTLRNKITTKYNANVQNPIKCNTILQNYIM